MPQPPGIDYAVMEEALGSLRRIPLPPGLKGLPPEPDGEPWTPAVLATAGLNALRDLPTPFAMVRRSALRHNAEVMGRWCADNGVLLAPHGKTTMAPALWKLQFETGTWALTVALPHQAVTAHRFGIRRILLANEAADLRSLEVLVRVAGQPGTEVYSFVDSVAGVRAYRAAIDNTGVEPIGLRFLIDIGVPGGRTGCRNKAEAESVAREIHQTGTAVVGGIGAYEGPAGHDRSAGTLASVNSYLESVTGIFRAFHEAGVFSTDDPPVLTIGGSDIFELVNEHVQHELASVDPYRLVIRSGCYLVHDHGHYAAVGPSAQPGWAYAPFQAALEVGATVVSRPQDDLALLNVGRRDIGFDMGSPSVIDPIPADGSRPLPIVKLNDQHAFVHPDESTFLPVGTPVRVGISHPCTTLDKWRVLLAVDDDYNVVDTVTTIF
ncbi:MAG: amino acid deaminase [Acidimicrobiia bacterium]|nr:amino acid deaminase [Acidimicrobiia bacterium]